MTTRVQPVGSNVVPALITTLIIGLGTPISFLMHHLRRLILVTQICVHDHLTKEQYEALCDLALHHLDVGDHHASCRDEPDGRYRGLDAEECRLLEACAYHRVPLNLVERFAPRYAYNTITRP